MKRGEINNMNIRLALLKVANELDASGLNREANIVTNVLKSVVAQVGGISVDDVLSMPDAQQIVKDARDWVADCQWAEDDPEFIQNLPDTSILLGVDRHYDGGLASFLQDRIPYNPQEQNPIEEYTV